MRDSKLIVAIAVAATFYASPAARAESIAPEQGAQSRVAMSEPDAPRAHTSEKTTPDYANRTADDVTPGVRRVALNAAVTPTARISSSPATVSPTDCIAIIQRQAVFVAPSF